MPIYQKIQGIVKIWQQIRYVACLLKKKPDSIQYIQS
jgi:hypothetical protein